MSCRAEIHPAPREGVPPAALHRQLRSISHSLDEEENDKRVFSKHGLSCSAGSDPASDSRGSLKHRNRLSQRADLFLMGKARKTLASSFHTDEDVNEFYIGLQ